MFKRVMIGGLLVVIVAVIAAFAYLQGYSDHANGLDIRLATSQQPNAGGMKND